MKKALGPEALSVDEDQDVTAAAPAKKRAAKTAKTSTAPKVSKTLKAAKALKAAKGPAKRGRRPTAQKAFGGEAAAAAAAPASAQAEGAPDDAEAAAPVRLRRRRKRTSAVNAQALIRAREAEARDDEESRALAADFNEAFPLPPEPADPNAPRTAPARLPDLPMIEAAEAKLAEERERQKRAKRRGPKKPPSVGARLQELVRSALEEAADHLLGRNNPEFALIPLNPVRVIVAFSGGRDSTALLHAAATIFRDKQQSLIEQVTAVYVNHGLSPNAGDWAAHCRAECEKRRIPFEEIRVKVRPKGDGIEAAARDARYKALAAYAKSHGFDIVMTAHHEDDRVETFLMQWMRGAGPEGLAAFPKSRELKAPSAVEAGERRIAAVPGAEREGSGEPGREGASPVLLVRPWISVLRRDVERYAKQKRLVWIEDESNDNPRYLRNRIRHEVLPLLEKIRPGFRTAAARSIGLVAEAADVLRSVAQSDLEACRSEENPRALSIFKLLQLIPARQAWCLRAWMSEEGMALPSKARIDDALRQVRETHSDTSLSIRVYGKEIRRWGADLVVLDASKKRPAGDRGGPVAWTWGLEPPESIALPGWQGSIEVRRCAPGEPGIAVARLADPCAKIEVRSRAGIARFKLWALRPAKPLKDLYAAAGIPAFERPDLPILLLNGEAVFAAGLGMDVRALDAPEAAAERVRFVWHPEGTLWNSKPIPNFGDLPEKERREREARLKAAAAAERAAEKERRAKREAAKAARRSR